MKILKNVGILGVGHYAPEKVLTNFDLEKMVDTSDEWIVERTGIKERRIASEDEATSDISIKAAYKALEMAKVKPEELDLIIVCTLTPDTVFPSVSCLLQDKLGAKNAGAFDLQAGCSGFVYGLTVACQLIASGLHKKVLVIGAEVLSKIVNWEDRNTCVIFADGAGAVVLGEVEDGTGYINSVLHADGSGGHLIIQPAGGSRMPASHETVEKKLHTVRMEGSEVFKFASRVVPKVTNEVLTGTGIDIKDIDIIIPHQANSRIITAAAKRLGISADKFFVNIERYGNTSAASVPLALSEAVEQGLIKKGDNVLLIGFGTGLTWAACVMKWSI